MEPVESSSGQEEGAEPAKLGVEAERGARAQLPRLGLRDVHAALAALQPKLSADAAPAGDDGLSVEAAAWFTTARLRRFAACLQKAPFLWRADHRACKKTSIRGLAYVKLLELLGERTKGKRCLLRAVSLCRVFVARLKEQLQWAAEKSQAKGQGLEGALELCPPWARHADSYLQLLPEIFSRLQSVQLAPIEGQTNTTTSSTAPCPYDFDTDSEQPQTSKKHAKKQKRKYTKKHNRNQKNKSVPSTATAVNTAGDQETEIDIDLRNFATNIMGALKDPYDNDFGSDQDAEINVELRNTHIANVSSKPSVNHDKNPDNENETIITNISTIPCVNDNRHIEHETMITNISTLPCVDNTENDHQTIVTNESTPPCVDDHCHIEHETMITNISTLPCVDNTENDHQTIVTNESTPPCVDDHCHIEHETMIPNISTLPCVDNTKNDHQTTVTNKSMPPCVDDHCHIEHETMITNISTLPCVDNTENDHQTIVTNESTPPCVDDHCHIEHETMITNISTLPCVDNTENDHQTIATNESTPPCVDDHCHIEHKTIITNISTLPCVDNTENDHQTMITNIVTLPCVNNTENDHQTIVTNESTPPRVDDNCHIEHENITTNVSMPPCFIDDNIDNSDNNSEANTTNASITPGVNDHSDNGSETNITNTPMAPSSQDGNNDKESEINVIKSTSPYVDDDSKEPEASTLPCVDDVIIHHESHESEENALKPPSVISDNCDIGLKAKAVNVPTMTCASNDNSDSENKRIPDYVCMVPCNTDVHSNQEIETNIENVSTASCATDVLACDDNSDKENETIPDNVCMVPCNTDVHSNKEIETNIENASTASCATDVLACDDNSDKENETIPDNVCMVPCNTDVHSNKEIETNIENVSTTSCATDVLVCDDNSDKENETIIDNVCMVPCNTNVHSNKEIETNIENVSTASCATDVLVCDDNSDKENQANLENYTTETNVTNDNSITENETEIENASTAPCATTDNCDKDIEPIIENVIMAPCDILSSDNENEWTESAVDPLQQDPSGDEPGSKKSVTQLCGALLRRWIELQQETKSRLRGHLRVHTTNSAEDIVVAIDASDEEQSNNDTVVDDDPSTKEDREYQAAFNKIKTALMMLGDKDDVAMGLSAKDVEGIERGEDEPFQGFQTRDITVSNHLSIESKSSNCDDGKSTTIAKNKNIITGNKPDAGVAKDEDLVQQSLIKDVLTIEAVPEQEIDNKHPRKHLKKKKSKMKVDFLAKKKNIYSKREKIREKGKDEPVQRLQTRDITVSNHVPIESKSSNCDDGKSTSIAKEKNIITGNKPDAGVAKDEDLVQQSLIKDVLTIEAVPEQEIDNKHPRKHLKKKKSKMKVDFLAKKKNIYSKREKIREKGKDEPVQRLQTRDITVSNHVPIESKSSNCDDGKSTSIAKEKNIITGNKPDAGVKKQQEEQEIDNKHPRKHVKKKKSKMKVDFLAKKKNIYSKREKIRSKSKKVPEQQEIDDASTVKHVKKLNSMSKVDLVAGNKTICSRRLKIHMKSGKNCEQDNARDNSRQQSHAKDKKLKYNKKVCSKRQKVYGSEMLHQNKPKHKTRYHQDHNNKIHRKKHVDKKFKNAIKLVIRNIAALQLSNRVRTEEQALLQQHHSTDTVISDVLEQFTNENSCKLAVKEKKIGTSRGDEETGVVRVRNYLFKRTHFKDMVFDQELEHLSEFDDNGKSNSVMSEETFSTNTKSDSRKDSFDTIDDVKEGVVDVYVMIPSPESNVRQHNVLHSPCPEVNTFEEHHVDENVTGLKSNIIGEHQGKDDARNPPLNILRDNEVDEYTASPEPNNKIHRKNIEVEKSVNNDASDVDMSRRSSCNSSNARLGDVDVTEAAFDPKLHTQPLVVLKKLSDRIWDIDNYNSLRHKSRSPPKSSTNSMQRRFSGPKSVKNKRARKISCNSNEDKSEGMVKRVKLPDIEEVRRKNRRMLTAQVTPITHQSGPVSAICEHVKSTNISTASAASSPDSCARCAAQRLPASPDSADAKPRRGAAARARSFIESYAAMQVKYKTPKIGVEPHHRKRRRRLPIESSSSDDASSAMNEDAVRTSSKSRCLKKRRGSARVRSVSSDDATSAVNVNVVPRTSLESHRHKKEIKSSDDESSVVDVVSTRELITFEDEENTVERTHSTSRDASSLLDEDEQITREHVSLENSPTSLNPVAQSLPLNKATSDQNEGTPKQQIATVQNDRDTPRLRSVADIHIAPETTSPILNEDIPTQDDFTIQTEEETDTHRRLECTTDVTSSPPTAAPSNLNAVVPTQALAEIQKKQEENTSDKPAKTGVTSRRKRKQRGGWRFTLPEDTSSILDETEPPPAVITSENEQETTSSSKPVTNSESVSDIAAHFDQNEGLAQHYPDAINRLKRVTSSPDASALNENAVTQDLTTIQNEQNTHRRKRQRRSRPRFKSPDDAASAPDECEPTRDLSLEDKQNTTIKPRRLPSSPAKAASSVIDKRVSYVCTSIRDLITFEDDETTSLQPVLSNAAVSALNNCETTRKLTTIRSKRKTDVHPSSKRLKRFASVSSDADVRNDESTPDPTTVLKIKTRSSKLTAQSVSSTNDPTVPNNSVSTGELTTSQNDEPTTASEQISRNASVPSNPAPLIALSDGDTTRELVEAHECSDSDSIFYDEPIILSDDDPQDFTKAPSDTTTSINPVQSVLYENTLAKLDFKRIAHPPSIPNATILATQDDVVKALKETTMKRQSITQDDIVKAVKGNVDVKACKGPVLATQKDVVKPPKRTVLTTQKDVVKPPKRTVLTTQKDVVKALKGPLLITQDDDVKTRKDMVLVTQDDVVKTLTGTVLTTKDNVAKTLKDPVPTTQDDIVKTRKSTVLVTQDDVVKTLKGPVPTTQDIVIVRKSLVLAKQKDVVKPPKHTLLTTQKDVAKALKGTVLATKDTFVETLKGPAPTTQDDIVKAGTVLVTQDDVVKALKGTVLATKDNVSKALKGPVLTMQDDIVKTRKDAVLAKQDNVVEALKGPVPTTQDNIVEALKDTALATHDDVLKAPKGTALAMQDKVVEVQKGTTLTTQDVVAEALRERRKSTDCNRDPIISALPSPVKRQTKCKFGFKPLLYRQKAVPNSSLLKESAVGLAQDEQETCTYFTDRQNELECSNTVEDDGNWTDSEMENDGNWIDSELEEDRASSIAQPFTEDNSADMIAEPFSEDVSVIHNSNVSDIGEDFDNQAMNAPDEFCPVIVSVRSLAPQPELADESNLQTQTTTGQPNPTNTSKQTEPIYLASDNVQRVTPDDLTENSAVSTDSPKVAACVVRVPSAQTNPSKAQSGAPDSGSKDKSPLTVITLKRAKTIKRVRFINPANSSSNVQDLPSDSPIGPKKVTHLREIVTLKRVKSMPPQVHIQTTVQTRKKPIVSILKPPSLIEASSESQVTTASSSLQFREILPKVISVSDIQPSKQTNPTNVATLAPKSKPRNLPKITLKRAEPVYASFQNSFQSFCHMEEVQKEANLPRVVDVTGDLHVMQPDNQMGLHLVVSQPEVTSDVSFSNINQIHTDDQRDDQIGLQYVVSQEEASTDNSLRNTNRVNTEEAVMLSEDQIGLMNLVEVSTSNDTSLANINRLDIDETAMQPDDERGNIVIPPESTNNSSPNINQNDIDETLMRPDDLATLTLVCRKEMATDDSAPTNPNDIAENSNNSSKTFNVVPRPRRIVIKRRPSVPLLVRSVMSGRRDSMRVMEVNPIGTITTGEPAMIDQSCATNYRTVEDWLSFGCAATIPSALWARGRPQDSLVLLCVGPAVWATRGPRPYLLLSERAPPPPVFALWTVSPRQGLELPDAESYSLASPPRKVEDGVAYQKVSDDPVTYAKLLVAVADARECRGLLQRGAPLHLYCLQTSQLYPLRAESLRDPPRFLLTGDAAAAEALFALKRELSQLGPLYPSLHNPPPPDSTVPTASTDTVVYNTPDLTPGSSGPSSSLNNPTLSSTTFTPVIADHDLITPGPSTTPNTTLTPDTFSPQDTTVLTTLDNCGPVPSTSSASRPPSPANDRPTTPTSPYSRPPTPTSPASNSSISTATAPSRPSTPSTLSAPSPDISPSLSPDPRPTRSPGPSSARSAPKPSTSRQSLDRPAAKKKTRKRSPLDWAVRSFSARAPGASSARWAAADEQFLAQYRLPKARVRALVDELRPLLPPMELGDMEPDEKVLTCLSFLATGSSPGSVSACAAVAQVADALNQDEVYKAYVRFPETPKERADIKHKFYERYKLPGVVGAMASLHVPVMEPDEDEQDYFNGVFHSLNVQVFCDADLRILGVDSGHGGGTHSCGVWLEHQLNYHLKFLRKWSDKVCLLGDSSYPQQESTLTPVEEPAARLDELYNAAHRHAYSVVGECIDALRARWRCLSTVSETTAPTQAVAAALVGACAVLHNIAKDVALPPDEEFTSSERRVAASVAAAQGTAASYLASARGAAHCAGRQLERGLVARRSVARQLDKETRKVSRPPPLASEPAPDMGSLLARLRRGRVERARLVQSARDTVVLDEDDDED